MRPIPAGFAVLGLLVLAPIAVAPASASAQTVFVNEIHYDNAGADADEGVEIAGPATTDLTGWALVGYNGSGGAPYSTTNLSGIIPDEGSGYGAVWFPITGLQNGSPDGVALVDDLGVVVQFLSYEGTFQAVGGAADGMMSVDIGVAEDGSTLVGDSLQLTGTGTTYGDFTWNPPSASSHDQVNPGQTFAGGPVVSIGNATAAEGDSGTTGFVFTITVSGSPSGTVSFDATVNDGTATVADGDYVDQNSVPLTIEPPATSTTFTVQVVGDTTVEPDETFTVTLANVTGAGAGDTTGQGTILNDDVVLIPVHDIQGNGDTSPLAGAVVTTHGIVTGLRSNAFYLQAPDAEADADPETSEGIVVFTSSAPTVAVGDDVQVTGSVSEYVPSADPFQPPVTEIGNPSLAVTVLSSGNALPGAVPLTAILPDPAGDFDQLERLEGMRVSVASMTVVGPTLGSVNEAEATATTNGVFFGVVTGVARPYREPGVQLPDPLPPGSPPGVPRFDTNPEILRVDSDAAGHAPLDVAAGAVVGGLVGPLDYTFRHYTIDPDAAAVLTVDGGAVPQAVSDPSATELTVASYNLERFFDDVDDPAISEPVLTPAAFDRRLSRASEGIRDYLKFPDVVGVAECENLATLQALADRIGSDAVAAAQPDPHYVPYLLEGHDIGGIDVGFLVKTAAVSGTVPRVEVLDVVQENPDELLFNPDLTTSFLNDRPTLRLRAVVHFASGESFPVAVLAQHLRSLSGIADESPGSNGWPSVGDRVRTKRLLQAQSVAAVVQGRQTTDPSEWIVLVGDFNAFEFNDGFVDSIGTILGAPAPDDETVVPGDGADLVDPDLTRLDEADGYSYVFDGSAQSLDHELVDAAMVAGTAARRVEHAHVNADFAEVTRNDDSTVARLSDHDPLVGYFRPAALDPGQLFRGDFETGDTRWWSVVVP